MVPVTVHVTYGKQLNIETEFESTLSSKTCLLTSIDGQVVLESNVWTCVLSSKVRYDLSVRFKGLSD